MNAIGMKNKKAPKNKSIWRSSIFRLVLVLVVIILIVIGSIHIFHKTQPVSGKIPVISTGAKDNVAPLTTKTTTQETSGSSSSTISSNTPAITNQDTDTQKPSTSSTPPLTPFGDFVSNHHPSLSGSSSPSTEQSVCNTTPDASCIITFTNDNSVVKSLPAQTANSSGSAYWAWNINTAGFTTGTWTISATAILNGQSISTSDPTLLTVEP